MDLDREEDGLYDIETLQRRVREVIAASDVPMNLQFRGRSTRGEETVPPPTHEGGPLRLGGD
jgi:hypothetical protein